MLIWRVVTAVIGIPILLALIYLGGWPLIIATGIFEAVMVYESEKMFRARKMPFFARMSLFWVWAILACQAWHRPLLWGLLAGLSVVVVGAVVLGRDASSFEGLLTTAWTSLYIGLLFMFLVAIRQMPFGARRVFVFFVLIWATDAVAYFVGRIFGKHKLMVHISPSKTWEGTLGGVAAAVVLGSLVSGFVHLAWYEGAFLALVIGSAGVVGDLLESQFKRYVGVKDSGGVLPGHGGVLDRFDSALLALPFAYYLFKGLGIG
ncbi:MAG: phosphatidate cytidylyltransferase [Sulfobacillus acidophilus]|uniref:Phosphatidate cytidylyltransferase n=1 Tax=Sulfobacillus acidophilus TaxID=53633 RepID=A0A2T2WNF2_9FIRM|nr:MAG: phosphatidate cytidylyltransferase [Sulfobacillus acidophilus]